MQSNEFQLDIIYHKTFDEIELVSQNPWICFVFAYQSCLLTRVVGAFPHSFGLWNTPHFGIICLLVHGFLSFSLNLTYLL